MLLNIWCLNYYKFLVCSRRNISHSLLIFDLQGDYHNFLFFDTSCIFVITKQNARRVIYRPFIVESSGILKWSPLLELLIKVAIHLNGTSICFYIIKFVLFQKYDVAYIYLLKRCCRSRIFKMSFFSCDRCVYIKNRNLINDFQS